MTATIKVLAAMDDASRDALAALLVAVVDDGAALGFLAPLAMDVARAYWSDVLAEPVSLVVAEDAGRIVGSAQLHRSTKMNARHRAEIAKVLVHPQARRRGIGRLLMLALEDIARDDERTLLVLDTREGDPSNQLYRSMAWREVGKIPGYARSSDGTLHATVIYFKEL